MAKFTHTRKGVIEGEVVKDDGEWMTIRLSHAYEDSRVSLDEGETLKVRKSLITKLED